MSASPNDRERADGFAIEPRNKPFEANRSLVDREIRPGRTISFVTEVDLREVDRVRTESWTRRKISYTAFVVKAVAVALGDYPEANRRVCRRGFWPFAGARLQAFAARDVAVNIEREVPGSEATAFLDVIRSADETPLDEITAKLQAMSKADVRSNEAWRESRGLVDRYPSWLSNLLIRLPLTSPKLWVKHRGGAALVSSPAKHGVDLVLGTWSHPVGISFGLVKPRPVVVGDAVVARPTFFLTLNFDRRVMTGAQAARFNKRIVGILENPVRELADFQISGGYFNEAWHAEVKGERKAVPPSGGANATAAKHPRDGATLEAPPTLPEMPVMPAYTLPPEVPDTRDEIDRVDEYPTVGD